MVIPLKTSEQQVKEESERKTYNNIYITVKTARLYNLLGKFLKDGANILAKPISEIYNLSIKYSLFPIDRQIAKLKPLFKKGSTTLPKNYLPNFITPFDI